MCVLEIGCGMGFIVIVYVFYVEYIYVFDVLEKMLEIVCLKVNVVGIENVMFEQLIVEDLVVFEGLVDVVMVYSILYFLEYKGVVI